MKLRDSTKNRTRGREEADLGHSQESASSNRWLRSEPGVARLVDLRFLLCVMLLGLLASGCQSTVPAPSTRLAWITITNRSQAEVEAATLDVFAQHSFQGGRSEPGRFTFEKPGNSWDQFAYGGWIDPNVWRRVLVAVKRMDDRTVLVDCDAYLVRFRGDYRFEEVRELSRRHRGAYQSLLDEIRDRFKWSPVPE